VSIAMSLLAILEEQPTYGLHLRNEFEERTRAMWPLNVGQVYATLGRLERDGLVRALRDGPEGQKVYEVTQSGRKRLGGWFGNSIQTLPPARDELVLKLIMTIGREDARSEDLIQRERKSAVQLLQELTTLKRNGSTENDIGWAFLLDSLIFQTEARVRWLDDCEARLRKATLSGTLPRRGQRTATSRETIEASR
jgi:DNA-binding PadR family transcriptional regulator